MKLALRRASRGRAKKRHSGWAAAPHVTGVKEQSEGSIDGGDVDHEPGRIGRHHGVAGRRKRISGMEGLAGPDDTGTKCAEGATDAGRNIGAGRSRMRRGMGGEMLSGSHWATSIIRVTKSPARKFPPPSGDAALKGRFLHSMCSIYAASHKLTRCQHVNILRCSIFAGGNGPRSGARPSPNRAPAACA